MGDPDTLFRLTEQIAFRQGIGDLLAEGLKVAHERTGAPDELALHVKGLELPMRSSWQARRWPILRHNPRVRITWKLP